MPLRRVPLLLLAVTAAVVGCVAGCSYRTFDAVVPADAAVVDVDAPSLDVAADTVDAVPLDTAFADTTDALALPASCLEVLARNPGVADGPRTIDPDGPGGVPPLEVHCDMTSGGGGWTRVANEGFSDAPTGFTRNVVTSCGTFGMILGGFQTFGRETVSKTFDLFGVPHQEVRVTFDFIVIDSWDHERAYLDVDGTRVWQKTCDKATPATCGQSSHICGRNIPDNFDGRVQADITTPHMTRSATLSFSADLDQALVDESWGLDNVAVFVR